MYSEAWASRSYYDCQRLDLCGMTRGETGYRIQTVLQDRKYTSGSIHSRGGSFKEIELSRLSKISCLRYSWLRFGLTSAGYHELGVHDRLVYTAGYLTADSTDQYETPGVILLSSSGVSCLNFFSD
jgi:hypothetical protein